MVVVEVVAVVVIDNDNDNVVVVVVVPARVAAPTRPTAPPKENPCIKSCNVILDRLVSYFVEVQLVHDVTAWASQGAFWTSNVVRKG